jgi:CBS domain-containing membrane protein
MVDWNRFCRFIVLDPVNLSKKGKTLSVIACFIAIYLVAWLTREFYLDTAYPIIVASMGASAVMLFIIPHSPLAQPWPLLGGQLVSAFVGIACSQALADPVLAVACAASGSVLVMLLLRCLHPPGTATALIPLISGDPVTSLGYHFVLVPVGLNVVVLLILGIAINRWGLGHSYPIAAPQASGPKTGRLGAPGEPLQRPDITDQDLEQALGNMDMFMDISPGDLNKLFTDVHKQRFERFQGNVTCGGIMVKNVLAVEYGTEVEEAWNIMLNENLKAMPVIDRSRRVIGIVTWNDFFKCVNLRASGTFQEKFRTFIRRTPDTSTDKPEAVGPDRVKTY